MTNEADRTVEIDLDVDLQGLDEYGTAVSRIDTAPEPERIVQGAWIVVGHDGEIAVAQIVEVAGDLVRVRPLPGPIGPPTRE